jgi:hypothetical protein
MRSSFLRLFSLVYHRTRSYWTNTRHTIIFKRTVETPGFDSCRMKVLFSSQHRDRLRGPQHPVQLAQGNRRPQELSCPNHLKRFGYVTHLNDVIHLYDQILCRPVSSHLQFKCVCECSDVGTYWCDNGHSCNWFHVNSHFQLRVSEISHISSFALKSPTDIVMSVLVNWFSDLV